MRVTDDPFFMQTETQNVYTREAAVAAEIRSHSLRKITTDPCFYLRLEEVVYE